MEKKGFVTGKTVLMCILCLCLLTMWWNPDAGQAGEDDVSHQTHLTGSRGPMLGTNCDGCHTSGTPSESDVDYGLCVPCHSPDGAYDGVNDPAIGAMNNWGADASAIYDPNGNLKAGKEKWCVGCHDDGSSVSQGITAPNISGQSMNGDWRSPVLVVESDIQGAGNLLDNDLETGNTSSSGSYMIFDLGGSVDISHLRLYVTLDSDTRWEVYGGNNLAEWARILLGQSILVGAPAWQTGSQNGWNEIRIDRFIPVRYVKLVRVSGWPLSVPAVSEFEFKAELEYGYYTNGHKVSCHNCHNTDSAHIDGIAQTYAAGSNNYQPAYRLSDVEMDGEVVPPLEIPRVECNWQEYPRTSNDFVLCFTCHDKHKLLGDAHALDDFFQDPLQTNFRNDDNPDENGNVTNEHLRHLRGRGYCGNSQDWDSDGDGTPDSPQSCPACHNIHGSPTPAMTRHGDLATDKAPMFNLQYIDEAGALDRDLSDVMESIGGQTQFYGAGAGTVEKNKTCNMCHKDQVTYYRTPVPSCSGCHSNMEKTCPAHYTHLQSNKGPAIDCWACHSASDDKPHGLGQLFADGRSFDETEVCDDCHSPGGAFDGIDDPVVGAKTNWADGVYEADGTTLMSGKNQWCATCHDNEPALSRASGSYAAIIVDNLDISEDDFVGDWPSYSVNPDKYGADFRYNAAGVGDDTATWRPVIPGAGEYSVYAWWSAASNRATNAKYKIYYDGPLTDPPFEVEVNQKENGGQWNWLWTGEFAVGGYVVLSDDANDYVIADAIKFENGGAVVPGIYAPNVIGDNTSYGFYATGHKINCLSCHDAGKNHFDHEHRTYEADESTGGVINPYAESYRLQGSNTMPSTTLCLDCHNSNEILGEDRWDVSHTNFWNSNPTISYIGNAHNYHIGLGYVHFDSDWDGVKDSRESCIACHNVHGSSYMTMIRDGKLISSYGTTDKEPALNFSYLVESTGPPATATWSAPNGTYYVYAWWSASSNRATNAPYTIYHDGIPEEIRVNQQVNGGQWNQLGAGTYTFVAGDSVVLSNEGADGYVIADAIGFDSDGDGNPDMIVDNDDSSVTYLPEAWPFASNNPDKYGDDIQYYAKQENLLMDPDATLQESVGARMDLAGGSIYYNGVCGACHAGISWERTPYLGPKVIDARADPATVVALDGTTTVLLTAFVFDHNDNVSNVTVDLSAIEGNLAQTMYDDGINGGDLTADDNIYSLETTVPVTVGSGFKSLIVTATDPDGDGKGEIVLQVTLPGEIIMDNPEAAYVGSWPFASNNPDKYGDDIQYNETGNGDDTATWRPDISEPGEYSVYAWWSASPNRATDAKYTVHYDGGFTDPPIEVDQEINGGQWNYLGTYPFVVGTSGSVVLSDDANEYVIADAIKWELQP